MIETENGVFEVFVAGEGHSLCVTHLYIINLRGCGNSTDNLSTYNYSMRDSILDLEAIRTALEIDRWGFAGHSTGGMLALAYAIQAPASLNFIVAGGLCPSSDYMYNEKSIYCKKKSAQ